MPVWNEKKKRYVAEKIEMFPEDETEPEQREERFRTALLNELDCLTGAILRLDLPSGSAGT